jgi:undecaprenyl-diphosphatase
MDYAIEQWINGPAGSIPPLDAVMKVVADGAEIIFLGLVAAWFLVGMARRQYKDRYGSVAAVLAAGAALAVNQGIAFFWSRPRPFTDHPTVHVLLSRSTDPSFPSDHAAAAFAIATVAILVRPRLGVAAVVLACLVAYSRVYVGAHYPGDVLGGALVGIVVGIVLVRLLEVVPRRLTDVGDFILAWLRLLGGDRR